MAGRGEGDRDEFGRRRYHNQGQDDGRDDRRYYGRQYDERGRGRGGGGRGHNDNRYHDHGRYMSDSRNNNNNNSNRHEENEIQDQDQYLQPGSIFKGRVSRIEHYGCFIDLPGGKRGLLHISQMAPHRVESVESEVQMGDEFFVVVLEIEAGGARIRLSRKGIDQTTGKLLLDKTFDAGSYRDYRKPRTTEHGVQRAKQREELFQRAAQGITWRDTSRPSDILLSRVWAASPSPPRELAKIATKDSTDDSDAHNDDDDDDGSNKSSDSEASNDSSESESSSEEERRRRRRRRKRREREHTKKRRRRRSPSTSSSESDSSSSSSSSSSASSSDQEQDDKKDLKDRLANKNNVNGGDPVKLDEQDLRDAQDFRQAVQGANGENAEDSDDDIGPMPLPQSNAAATDANAGRNSYGDALLPGEGQAIAAFVQQNLRIPRRGEIGYSGDQIERYESSGYVMSGSRHARMNAVRIRKENQVYSAEEQRALALITMEENQQKEAQLMEDFRIMLKQKQQDRLAQSK